MQLPSPDAIDAAIAKKSLHAFGVLFWDTVSTVPYIQNWHNECIAEHLEACTRGQIQNLLINQPPGTAKSLWTAVFMPAWLWTWKPEAALLFATYEENLTIRDSMRTKKIIESKFYETHYKIPSGWDFDPSQNEKSFFWNTKLGFRQCFTVGTGGTGHRGHGIAVDDPVGAADCYNLAKHKRAADWYDRAFRNRMLNPADFFRVVTMQRLHHSDLSEHLKDMGYQKLIIPSEYNPKKSFVTFWRPGGQTDKDAIFWEDKRTEEKELLFPALYTADVIAQEKQSLGADYSAQHQQDPTNEKGSKFLRLNWRFWETGNAGPRPQGCTLLPARSKPEQFDEIFISADFACKDEELSDWHCYTLIGRIGNDYFVLDRVREKFDFDAGKAALKLLINQNRTSPQWYERCSRAIIEDKANGIPIIQSLSKELTGIEAFNPGRSSKVERVQVTKHSQAGGHWYLPEGAPWLDEWVGEFAQFPRGANDDQVDTYTQAVLATSEDTDLARANSLCSA